MTTKKLDDKTIAAIKAEDGKRIEVWDEQTRGLCLRVSSAGGVQRKVWVWRYRTPDGRQPRLRLGEYGDSKGLRWARLRVGVLKAQVEEGGDPAGEKRRAKAEEKAETLRTFDDLADAYLTACANGLWKPRKKQKRDRTINDERAILKRYVRPELGKKPLNEIDRAAVRSVLRKMILRKIGAQTNRTHAVIRQCFSYAVSEDRLLTNPATGFAPLADEAPRSRIMSDEELSLIWSTLVSPAGLRVPPRKENPEGTPLYLSRPMAIALQLGILLLQRRAEILGMRRSELNLAEGVWSIPADRMKGGKPHMVPLPPRAVALIEEAVRLSAYGTKDGKVPDPIFPSPRDPVRPMRPDSMTHALGDLIAATGMTSATVHDLRRTGATVMASERLGIAPFIVSRVLAHNSDTGGGALVTFQHYNLHQYAAEKRRALEGWGALLLQIVGEAGSSGAASDNGASDDEG